MPTSIYNNLESVKNSTVPIEKTPDKNFHDPWITSGKLGSKDAVLIFRTDTLNDFDDLPLKSKSPSPAVLQATSSKPNTKSFQVLQEVKDLEPLLLSENNSKTIVNNTSNKRNINNINNNNNSNPNLNNSSIINFNSNSCIKNNKILTPLPRNNIENNSSSSSSNSNILLQHQTQDDSRNQHQQNQLQLPQRSISGIITSVNSNKKSTSQPNLAKIQTINDYQKLNQNRSPLNLIKSSPKKRLHDSLSSSESSISTDNDELFESKSNIMKNSDKIINDVKQDKENYDQSNKENIDDFQILDPCDMPAFHLNITYKFMNTETRLLKKIFARHGLVESENDQPFTLLWTGVHMKPDILRNLTPYQRVNHFPRSYELTRKDRLYKNIEKMQHLRGFKHFDIIPQSYVLPTEFKDLITAHNKYRGPWIVKPAASSRGRGIFIITNPDQIPAEEACLVSKYIANPLCIDGHKCDIRVYVLVTSFDPLIIYIYEEGLVRLATVKYNRNTENLWNPCMHLCNYSINKYHSDYIKSADVLDEDVGHKWTLSALLRHLRSQGCDTNQLMSSIEDLIIKSLFACAQSVISACRMFVPNGNNCFELYGFDILIDDTLKPWLLEINLSPSLGIDSPLDTKVKASLMCSLLTLVGIPAYSPVMRAHYDTNWTRFRNIDYSRKTASADPLNSAMSTSTGGGVKKQNAVVKNENLLALTTEEIKVLKNLKLQNARRGGFVRVFPTEDCMAKYSSFLDSVTGIPLSTTMIGGPSPFSMTFPHNYNHLVFNHFYSKDAKDKSLQDNSFEQRMLQYERVLEAGKTLLYRPRAKQPKSIEEGKRLRRRIRQLIENGSELTHLQARQAFYHYLELVLKRLTEEPKSLHEKLILKFINRTSGGKSAPFLNSLNFKMTNKDRTAMVAKLLGDYLDTYIRETEAYIDPFDNYGMISINLFKEFIKHADESDLESVLTLNTNLTHSMPFLYNRCSFNIPTAPPIPTGPHGFLKALPCMVPGYNSRDNTKIDQYYKSVSSTDENCEKSNESIADCKGSLSNTSTSSSVTSKNNSNTNTNNRNVKLNLKDGNNSNGQSPKQKPQSVKSSVITKSPKRKIQSRR
ncbi:probable beta-tubulin polyglutamylase isoform X3 [Condylostylus longicornis]|nr:probable beta-tubulin polyglutamylase isoform X3 [Condylostylus longicornis]XP_055371764.1 probable beta-tubulin polyglutamylase isoform X3 [Condylostylus longicornis]XP_055371765.1 probable beta-tubulin polyglutamylase isoform X3 [Condylostylus longicornis]XP_055371766.1 probable beta-tubulin polyglutamylase isoform X3 [Condylostylus longicornis]XP_055371767.1 probable beta-tubulin polyglutamylase isoform X3 [Condylostylus longicornis]XP_055371769.1 probable beta-tubulin polyglutamylase is